MSFQSNKFKIENIPHPATTIKKILKSSSLLAYYKNLGEGCKHIIERFKQKNKTTKLYISIPVGCKLFSSSGATQRGRDRETEDSSPVFFVMGATQLQHVSSKTRSFNSYLGDVPYVNYFFLNPNPALSA